MNILDRAQGTETPRSRAEMQLVPCTECLAEVLVRKSTWAQTSVQWSDESLQLCRERPAGAGGKLPREQFVGCETLRAVIREATVQGKVGLADQTAS